MKRLLFVCMFTLFATTIGCHRQAKANVPLAWSDGATIEAVRVSGNHQVEITTIAAVMQTKAGGKIDSETIRGDISRLRSLGFENIKVKEEKGDNGGRVLTFEMKEKLPKMKS